MNQIEFCQLLLKMGIVFNSNSWGDEVKRMKPIKIRRGTRLDDLHDSEVIEHDDHIEIV